MLEETKPTTGQAVGKKSKVKEASHKGDENKIVNGRITSPSD